MTEKPAATSPPGTMVFPLIVGAAAVLAGQLLHQTYPDRSNYEVILPTLGGLLLLGVAFSESLLSRAPPQLAALRRPLDPGASALPLYLAAIVAATTAAVIAGESVILRLPALAVGFWLAGIVAVLAAASALGRPSSRLSRWEFAGLLAVVIAAAILRTVRLNEIPWLLAGDEASVGISAREFLDGGWTNPFRVAWYSFPSMFFLLPAASIAAFGQTVEALRLPAAIAGTLTVVALFVYARSAFGKTLAFFAAGYLGFFHFHVHFSRIALNNIWDALFLTLFSWLLWRAWTEERPALFAWAGIVAGLGQYFYTSTRLLLLLVPLWMAVAAWRERAKSRRIGWNWGVMLVAAFVVVLPLAAFYARYPDEFTAPMQRVSLLGGWLEREVAATGLPAWRILATRIGISALVFTASNLRHWYTIDHPMLLPLPATLFLVGFVITVLRARDLRYLWLLLWLAAGVLVGGLSESTPAAQRYIFVAPAVALLVALPVVEAAQYFARSDSATRTRLAIAGGAVLLIAALLDFRFYFFEYTPARRFSDVNTEVAQNLGRFLQAEGLDQGAQVYFSGMPRMGWKSIETLPYLVPGDTFTDIVEPLTAPPTWAAEPPAVFVFLPENLGDLAWVERAYPGGETVVRTAEGDRDLYTAYLLR